MSESTKTTKDLLKKVEEQRADESPEVLAPALKKVSFSNYLTKKDHRDKEIAERRLKEEEAKELSKKEQEAEKLRKEDNESIPKEEEPAIIAEERLNTQAEDAEITDSVKDEQLEHAVLESTTKASTTQEYSPHVDTSAGSVPVSAAAEASAPQPPLSSGSSLSYLSTIKSTATAGSAGPEPALIEAVSAVSDDQDVSAQRPTSTAATASTELSSLQTSKSDRVSGYRPSDEDSDDGIRVGSNRGSSVAPDEDSGAETDHADSPQRRPTRLLQMSSLARSKTVPRLDSDDEMEDSDDEGRRALEKQKRSRSRESVSKPQSRKHVDPKTGESSLHRACTRGDYALVKELIEQGSSVDSTDHAGNTPLLNAAVEGETEISRLLIENGSDVNVRNVDGDTPLIDATANLHTETVQLLLESGANPWRENIVGNTALDDLYDYHEESELTLQLKQILQRACRDYIEKYGAESVHATHPSADQGYESKNSNSRSRPSALRSRTDEVPLLITGKGAFVTLREKVAQGDVSYVLSYLESGLKHDPESVALAARAGHYDIVNFFIALAQPDLNAVTSKKGQTALMRAVGRNHPNIVKLLLESGSKVKLRSSEGKTALDYAEHGLYVDPEEIALLKSFADREGESTSFDGSYTAPTQSKKAQKKKKPVTHRDESAEPPQKKTKTSRSSSKHREKSGDKRVVSGSKDHNSRSSSKSRGKSQAQPQVMAQRTNESPVIESKPSETEEEKAVRVKREAEDEAIRVKREEEERITRAKREEDERLAIEIRDAEEKRLAALRLEERRKQEEEDKRIAAIKAEERRKEAEEFTARDAAQKALRRQQFLNSLEEDRNRQQQKIQELQRQEEEREKKVVEALEAQKREEQRQKELMSKKGENERREQIRNQYPSGLRRATFSSTPRSKEEMLQYLSLYKITIDGVEYVADTQVVLALGIDDFLDRFNGKFSKRIALTKADKRAIFGFFYPFLKPLGDMSVSGRLENQRDELEKCLRLQMNWIKYDELIELMHDEFSDLEKFIISNTASIEFSAVQTETFVRPQLTNTRNVSSAVLAPDQKKFPLLFRGRPAVLKVLARNKPIWGRPT